LSERRGGKISAERRPAPPTLENDLTEPSSTRWKTSAGFAEYVSVPSLPWLSKIPDGMSMEEASVVGFAG